MSRAVILVANDAERVATESCVGQGKPGCIERVEELSADFQKLAFREFHSLGNAQINVVNALGAAI